MDIDLKQLKELMRSLKQFDIGELEIEKNGERIKLARSSGEQLVHGPINVMPSLPSGPAQAAEASAAKVESAKADEASVHYITSPFVGTFYASPSPDADAFVRVGSEIQSGQRLCIVEAMKLMNEIEADVNGTILEILAENGKPVEYGDRLFRVRKKS